MCIILAKPAGVALPTTTTLDNCFTSNRDGIGFAFNLPGQDPIICKGFANVKKLEKMMETFNISADHNLMIHFRLATHGKTDQGNCHPFPLTHNFEDMRLLHCTCDVAISHNGIFGSLPASQKHSDTMKFISTILASPEIIANIESKSVQELVKGYCGLTSKLAFLKADGFQFVGNFEVDEGTYYSNNSYKAWENRNVDWSLEYCQDHRTYDKCSKKWKAEGKEWCYIHKEWDFCTWCYDHRKWDMCEYDKKKLCGVVTDGTCGAKAPIIIVDSKGDTRMDTRTQTDTGTLDLRKYAPSKVPCEYCGTKEDVSYCHEIQASLCGSCALLYVQGYGGH